MKCHCQMSLAPCSELFAIMASEPGLCAGLLSLNKIRNENEFVLSLQMPTARGVGCCNLTALGLNGTFSSSSSRAGWYPGVCASTGGVDPSLALAGGGWGGVHPVTLLLSLQGGPGVPGAVAADVRALLGQ